MELKDERMNIMNDSLLGIKILKLYAWEPSFNDLIGSVRKKELNAMRKKFWLNSLVWFLSNCSVLLISVIMFSTYVLTGENHVITPTLAFVTISLLDIIEEPLSFVTEMISAIVLMRVSLKRLNRFMNLKELDADQIEHTEIDNAVLVENASFTWQSEGKHVLTDLMLEVPKGALVAIVGPVGSGKSSLLMALLGEMLKIQGKVNVHGSVALVPQVAWIQNTTLRDNILFGNTFDELQYNRILDACSLTADLDILPAGDMTEIGERGINLSGGQKQRVSLARAVYNDADIYLLDDPLSAVDAHVGRHIFNKVIGPKSLLRHKTRILVTHGLVHLPEVDVIIMLEEGRILERGTYLELVDANGHFADLMKISQLEASTEEKSKHTANISRQDSRFLRQISKRSEYSFTDDSTLYEDESINDAEDGHLIRPEGLQTGQVAWHNYRYYLSSIGWLPFAVILILYTIQYSALVGKDVWLSIWSNDPPTTSVKKRDTRLGVYGGLASVNAIFMFLTYIIAQLSMLRASRFLHENMLMRILRCPMSFFDVTPLGRIVNRFSHDVDIVDEALPDVIMSMLEMIFELIGIAVVICLGNPLVAAVLFPLGLLYYGIQKLYISTACQLRRLLSNYRSPIYSHFSETICGLVTLRAFKKQEIFSDEFNKKVDMNHKVVYASFTAQRWLSFRLGCLGTAVIFATAFFAVMKRDTIDSGTLGLSVSYAITINYVFIEITKLLSNLETNIVSVERIKEYSEAPSEAPWELEYEPINSDWPEGGNIKFVNYSTRYRDELNPVLQEITCEFREGEKIGVVGRTGAGKSSLTLALFRLIEATDGKIVIDGVNIAELGLHSIRSRLTIIPQDPVLFCGTLRMNLDPFNHFTDEQLWYALEHSHLKGFVSSLDEGLLHPISEGGENLSVGQRQLLCLARALLRKSKILVLDEATAAVDVETDELIQSTIRNEFADCTILTIAHRLNTIMDSTRVLVLQNGAIKEFESPTTLLEDQNSLFYEMAKDSGVMASK